MILGSTHASHAWMQSSQVLSGETLYNKAYLLGRQKPHIPQQRQHPSCGTIFMRAHNHAQHFDFSLEHGIRSVALMQDSQVLCLPLAGCGKMRCHDQPGRTEITAFGHCCTRPAANSGHPGRSSLRCHSKVHSVEAVAMVFMSRYDTFAYKGRRAVARMLNAGL